MTRRRFVQLFIVVICVALLSACARHRPAANLRLGYLPIAECTPLFVAQTEGIFQKHGLTVELTEFDAGPTVIAAALGGSLDGGLSGVTPLFFAMEKAKPLVLTNDGGHVVKADHPYVGLVVSASSRIRTVAELKGKTVAVNGLKTIEDALLRVALRKAQLEDGVEVVTLPHPNMVPALSRGTIDASMAIEPYIASGLAAGSIRVLMGSEEIIPSFQVSAIFFTKVYADAHPSEIQKFTVAYNEAIEWIEANPQGAKEVVSQWTKTPIETASGMTLPGWSKTLNVSAVRAAQQAMLENHILDHSVDLTPFLPRPNQ